MKIKDIYSRAVATGIELDPRGADAVQKELSIVQKEYDEMREKEREGFDVESLTNPYSDTRILYGDPERQVKKLMLGIDMEVGELLLADRLGDIDLVVAHHPEGRAMAALYGVMGMQSGILLKHGVPINVAESIMGERINEVERGLMPVNHTRSVDAARLLDMPYMCCHTPSDNAVTDYLNAVIDEKDPYTVSDIVDLLREIPEYAHAVDKTVAPKVVSGDKKRKSGKVFVDMTGGTGGSKKAYESLSHAGIGTVIGMHISEDHLKEAKRNHVNIIIAGHISSDTLGLNLLLDRILDEGVEVVATSGFHRVKR